MLYKSFNKTEIRYNKLLKFFKILLIYITRHYGFFHAIFVTHPNRDLFSDYVNETKVTYTKMLDDYTQVKNIRQFVTYAIGGQVGIIYYWIREGCSDSPGELAKILLANATKLER